MTTFTTIRTTVFARQNTRRDEITTKMAISRAAARFVTENPRYGHSLFDEQFVLQHANLFAHGTPSPTTLAKTYIIQLGRRTSLQNVQRVLPVAARFLRIYAEEAP
jgi:hypothetical protein